MRQYILPDIKSFRNKKELYAWRDKEISRWVNGYDGLSGLHYFILSQGTFIRIDGRLVKPYYRDVDEWILGHFLECRRKGKFAGYAKRREIGLSSFFGAGVAAYYAFTEPGSTCLITSCDPERLFSLKNDKLTPFLKNMHPAFRPNIVYDRTTQNDVYTQISLMVDYGDEVKEVFSEFFFKNTSKDASFSAKRGTYGFYDEIALHPKPKKLITSSRDCYSFQGKIRGTLVVGGTVEHDISEESLSVLRGLVYDSQMYDIDWFLIEGWMGLFLDERGISDKEKGLMYIEQEYEKKLKSGDNYAAKSYKKNYPLCWDDVLEGVGTTLLKEDLNARIHDRLLELRMAGRNDVKSMMTVKNDMVCFEPSDTGEFWACEDCLLPTNSIIVGVDTVTIQPHVGARSHSYFCMAIKDATRGVYVGWYQTKMFQSNKIIEILKNIAAHCSNLMIMVERNKGDSFIMLLINSGLKEYLCLEPVWMTSLSQRGVRKYGYHKNDHSIMDMVITYVDKNLEKIFSPGLLRAVANFNPKNDLLNAVTAAEIADAERIKQLNYIKNIEEAPSPKKYTWQVIGNRRVVR